MWLKSAIVTSHELSAATEDWPGVLADTGKMFLRVKQTIIPAALHSHYGLFFFFSNISERHLPLPGVLFTIQWEIIDMASVQLEYKDQTSCLNACEKTCA